MREIIIKNTPLKEFKKVNNIEKYFTCSTGTPENIKDKKVIYSNIEGIIPHKTFQDYLEIGYNNDYGVVISPNHIWFSVLCKVASIIKSEPEYFRENFTDVNEKVELTLPRGAANSMIEMPMDKMLNLLLDTIPIKLIKEQIIPSISTTTPEFELACAAIFLDAASPYYYYSYYGCMYNKIKILGTSEDYETLSTSFNQTFIRYFKSHKVFNEIQQLLRRIEDNYNDDEFWKRILWTEQGYITKNRDGWILGLSSDTKFAVVEYKELESQKKYALCTGLFSSIIEDDYMIPNFEKIIVDLDIEDKDDTFKYYNLIAEAT